MRRLAIKVSQIQLIARKDDSKKLIQKRFLPGFWQEYSSSSAIKQHGRRKRNPLENFSLKINIEKLGSLQRHSQGVAGSDVGLHYSLFGKQIGNPGEFLQSLAITWMFLGEIVECNSNERWQEKP